MSELESFKKDCLNILNPSPDIDPNEVVGVTVWDIAAVLAKVLGSKSVPVMKNSSEIFKELKKLDKKLLEH